MYYIANFSGEVLTHPRYMLLYCTLTPPCRHTSKQETDVLNNNLPPDLAKVTHNMTLKRLLRNGITYVELQNLFTNSISFLDFFARLDGMGIERKAAKSIANRLSSMGLSCEGSDLCETPREVFDTEDYIFDTEDVPTEEKEEVVQISRSDSGYGSTSPSESEHDLVFFYNMFVDEFFYPPEVYEYIFGSFSHDDIDDMDQYIAEIFDARYPEYFDNPDYKGPQLDEKPGVVFGDQKPDVDVLPNLDKNSNLELGSFQDHIREMEIKKYEQIRERAAEEYKGILPESSETWDDEMGEVGEFDLSQDTGCLAKVVPIGMTMDNLSGATGLSGKVPLFTHFQGLDLSSRPSGGLPKMGGKAGARERNRMKRENKKLQREMNCCDDGARTVVKSKSGEVFVLV